MKKVFFAGIPQDVVPAYEPSTNRSCFAPCSVFFAALVLFLFAGCIPAQVQQTQALGLKALDVGILAVNENNTVALVALDDAKNCFSAAAEFIGAPDSPVEYSSENVKYYSDLTREIALLKNSMAAAAKKIIPESIAEKARVPWEALTGIIIAVGGAIQLWRKTKQAKQKTNEAEDNLAAADENAEAGATMSKILENIQGAFPESREKIKSIITEGVAKSSVSGTIRDIHEAVNKK